MLDPQPIQLVQPALLIRHARRSTAMNTLSQDLARLRHEELLAAARRERPARRLARALRAERRADRAAARAAKAASVARLRLARAL